MKILLDFLPIIVFFAVFKMYGIYAATGSAIVVTFLQVVYEWFSKRQVSKTLWINLVLITLLGGATIIFHDETFIKWKPTAIYTLFGLILLGGKIIFKKNLLQSLIGGALVLEEKLWGYLNLAWAVFFFILASLNIYVAYTYPLDTWVNFKLFGLLGLTFFFVILQSVIITIIQARVNR